MNAEGADGRSKTLKQATASAAACSLEIHSKLHNWVAHEDDDPAKRVLLSLHMGLACGELMGIHVGGVFNRYEFVVTGEPMGHIGIAEPLAKSGETVLSPLAANVLGDELLRGRSYPAQPGYVLITGLKSPVAKLDPSTVAGFPALNSGTAAILQRYCPGAIMKSLTAGEFDSESTAELRDISVLFINVTGLNLTPSGGDDGLVEAAERGQTLMLQIQKCLYAVEGALNKMLVDDKGLLILGALGLPPMPHDDDAERAITAAIAIAQSIPELYPGVSCSVGITTGQCFCGVIGSPLRREYTVMGDRLNLAARLMAAAAALAGDHPRVLVDEATYSAARRMFVFQEVDPLKVKGKEKKVIARHQKEARALRDFFQEAKTAYQQLEELKERRRFEMESQI